MSGETYFLYHSIGQYPNKTKDLTDAMAEFSTSWGAEDDSQWAYALGKRQAFIDRWRAIIKAPDGTLTTTESVTQAFHMLLTSLPQGHLNGRKVLVGADCFPSNHFLLQGICERYGFEIKTVALRQGAAHVEDEDFLNDWTPDVGLALLTWVSSLTSHRINLAALTAHGRRMGSLIGVDITQAAGLLPFDVNAPEIDFAVSTSLKWMCGTPGAGILYLAPRLIPLCHPELRGWFSQANPFNWDINSFAYAPDIRRFDNGTPGTMAALASLPALDWHATQDQTQILAHNRRLTARLIDAADELNLPLLTPRATEKRGGSIMLRLPDHLKAADVVATLRAQSITTDARGQTLRLSPGIMTAETGTDRLILALKSLI